MNAYREDDIKAVLSKVKWPAFVSRHFFQPYTDSTGEPAVWIWVIISDQKAASKDFARGVESIRKKLREAFRQERVDLWPYTSFRTVSEQEELDKEDARARKKTARRPRAPQSAYGSGRRIAHEPA